MFRGSVIFGVTVRVEVSSSQCGLTVGDDGGRGGTCAGDRANSPR